jgi:hypothetical protein
MRPLDSRLSALREASEKYSTSVRSRTLGLEAASFAMPTSGDATGCAAGAGNAPVSVEVGVEEGWALSIAVRLPAEDNYFRFLFAYCQEESL